VLRSSLVPIRVKGDPNSLGQNVAQAGYLPEALDCREWNAASFLIIPSGGGSVDLVFEGAGAEGGASATMADPMATQLGLTAPTCIELSVGCEAVKVRVTQITGTVTVIGTPFIAGSGMSVSQASVGVAAVQGTASDLASGTNAAATVTYAATTNRQHRIAGVLVSYSTTPTNGRLTVSDGATVILDVDVTAAGPTPIALPKPIKGSTNTALSATLAAGGVGVVGKVTVLGHGTE
jgi:hypothetical protein